MHMARVRVTSVLESSCIFLIILSYWDLQGDLENEIVFFKGPGKSNSSSDWESACEMLFQVLSNATV